jgi:hypothetical protein
MILPKWGSLGINLTSGSLEPKIKGLNPCRIRAVEDPENKFRFYRKTPECLALPVES